MAMLPVEMLKKLGSGVRPDGAQKSRRSGGGGTIDFGAMVAAARAGSIRSPRSATWQRGEHEDDLERCRDVLEEALDRAEAAGIETLIVALGHRLLRADVPNRAVEPIESDGHSVLSLLPTAFLMLRVDEDAVGELESLEAIESGTRSAKRFIPAGMGWIGNRSLEAIVASVDRSTDERE
ncbi:MAG: hypothetical protein ACIAQF_01320 [Phycisphaerales bacterium JB065]